MIAVFYDVENLRESMNYKEAIEKVSALYKNERCLQFAYAEWDSIDDDCCSLFAKNKINKKQINICHSYLPFFDKSVKLYLAIEAIEMVLTNKTIERFVIVNCNRSYISLINKLKEYDKFVDIISLKKDLTKSIIKTVDNVYLLDSNDDKVVPIKHQSIKKKDLKVNLKKMNKNYKKVMQHKSKSQGNTTNIIYSFLQKFTKAKKKSRND